MKLFLIYFLLIPQLIFGQPAELIFPDGEKSVTGGKYALIAGGSKGIGYALAEAAAKRKFNLVLIARHADSLVDAKQKLKSAYGINVIIIQLDLTREKSAEAIAEWCIGNNLPLKLLCNVAGYGGSRDYLSLPLDTVRYMIDLNLGSVMALSMTLLPLLERNAPAYILNVSSLAGFAPIPSKNMYSSTKAAVISFSQALNFQLRNKRISVSCLTPGPVFTKPEIVEETKKKLGWIGMQMAVTPSKVGEVAIRQTLKGRRIIVPGFLAKISSIVQRVTPDRILVPILGRAGLK